MIHLKPNVMSPTEVGFYGTETTWYILGKSKGLSSNMQWRVQRMISLGRIKRFETSCGKRNSL